MQALQTRCTQRQIAAVTTPAACQLTCRPYATRSVLQWGAVDAAAAPRRAVAAFAAPAKSGDKPASKGFGAPKQSTPAERCDCCSGKAYKECCKQYHEGAVAPTMEATLRARFSAYCRYKNDYILGTTHPDYLAAEYGEDKAKALEKMKSAIAEGCDSFNYATLKVLNTMPGDSEDDGYIIFNYKMAKKASRREGFTPLNADMVIERSKFVRQDGVWKFRDYQMVKCPEGLGAEAQEKAMEAVMAADMSGKPKA